MSKHVRRQLEFIKRLGLKVIALQNGGRHLRVKIMRQDGAQQTFSIPRGAHQSEDKLLIQQQNLRHFMRKEERLR
jgi:hypothetical protein